MLNNNNGKTKFLGLGSYPFLEKIAANEEVAAPAPVADIISDVVPQQQQQVQVAQAAPQRQVAQQQAQAPAPAPQAQAPVQVPLAQAPVAQAPQQANYPTDFGGKVRDLYDYTKQQGVNEFNNAIEYLKSKGTEGLNAASNYWDRGSRAWDAAINAWNAKAPGSINTLPAPAAAPAAAPAPAPQQQGIPYRDYVGDNPLMDREVAPLSGVPGSKYFGATPATSSPMMSLNPAIRNAPPPPTWGDMISNRLNDAYTYLADKGTQGFNAATDYLAEKGRQGFDAATDYLSEKGRQGFDAASDYISDLGNQSYNTATKYLKDISNQGMDALGNIKNEYMAGRGKGIPSKPLQLTTKGPHTPTRPSQNLPTPGKNRPTSRRITTPRVGPTRSNTSQTRRNRGGSASW